MENPLLSLSIENRIIARVGQLQKGGNPVVDIRTDADISEVTRILQVALKCLIRAQKPHLFDNCPHSIDTMPIPFPGQIVEEKRFGTDLAFFRCDR